jgi:ABC-2 type transport system ATP-binding protein
MVASRIAIIDHGKIIITGSVHDLLKHTQTDNLEQAYLQLTGKSLRDEEVSSGEASRMRARARRNR